MQTTLSEQVQPIHGGEPWLNPIERPRKLLVKAAYIFSKRVFGKVLAPFKILYARRPFLISVARSFEKGKGKLLLPEPLPTMILYAVANHNGCSFCADMKLAEAAKRKLGREIFRAIAANDLSRLAAREAIALSCVQEVLDHGSPSRATRTELKAHFSEEEIVEIIWLIAVERYYNTLARSFDIASDGLADEWNMV